MGHIGCPDQQQAEEYENLNCFITVSFSVCLDLAFLHFAILHEFGKLLLGLAELLHEILVSMQTRNDSAGHYTRGIDIALEMIPADHTALPHFKSSFEDFVLTIHIDLSQYERRSPTDGGMP